MDKREIILAGLYPESHKIYTPVQVQKLFFLIDKNLTEYINGPIFDFRPYNYGPFDKTVYQTLDELSKEKLVEIIPYNFRLNYRLSDTGKKEGEKIFNSLDKISQEYISKASNFVLSLTFSELVSAIYKAYPEMRVNSVFQEH